VKDYPKACIAGLIVVLGLLLLNGCTSFPRHVPSVPFGPDETRRVLALFKEQESLVHTFVSSGRLKMRAKGPESESSFLIAGTRDPYKIKIEITHLWGKPILHILIDGIQLGVLSFSEKRLYKGTLDELGRLKFFPAHLRTDQIWALARAYPALSEYDRAVSMKGHQVTLLDSKEQPVQVIDFYPQPDLLPRLITFPAQDTRVSFSDFQNSSGIYYAQNVGVAGRNPDTEITFELKQMILNRPIPNEVLMLTSPPDFEVMPLPEG
jgi:hypothetical protein